MSPESISPRCWLGRRHLKELRLGVCLAFGFWDLASSASLERHQHEHQPFAFFQTAHGLAKDRALSFGVVSNLHRMTWRIGCGEQIAGLDCAKGGVGLDLDATAQGHVLAAFDGTFLVEADSWSDSVGAADHASHALVIGVLA